MALALARSAENVWRRLARMVGAERVAATVARARLVEESVEFARRELSRSQGVGSYRLRQTGVAFCVRHDTPDVFAFDQAFRQRQFDLPSDVSAALGDSSTSLRVVDLGANIGLFCAHALGHYPTSSFVAFEPDRSNAKVLECAIRENCASKRWEVVAACAGPEDGWVQFTEGQFGLSHIEDGPSASRVRALDVFPYLEQADLVKIDIEGSEWALLDDTRFRGLPAKAIHMEYHRHMSPHDDPRAGAEAALEGAGYRVRLVRHEPVGNGIFWAWKS